MRDQQTNELTPATKQASNKPHVRWPRLGFSSFPALRALATLLISILIMLAGTLAAATLA